MTSVVAVCSELLWPQGEQFPHMVQSSTYFTCPQDVCKSCMSCIKPIGPNIVPCGTPALIVVKSDFTSPIFTRCLRWPRKDVSHLMMKFGSPSEVYVNVKARKEGWRTDRVTRMFKNNSLPSLTCFVDQLPIFFNANHPPMLVQALTYF